MLKREVGWEIGYLEVELTGFKKGDIDDIGVVDWIVSIVSGRGRGGKWVSLRRRKSTIYC